MSIIIEDYNVPIFQAFIPWDISFRHIIYYIDGISHVKKIIQDINMDAEFVKKSLTLLIYYNIIILSDIFKLPNIYKLKLRNIDLARLLAFARDRGIIRRLYEYPIYLNHAASCSSSNTDRDESPSLLASAKPLCNTTSRNSNSSNNSSNYNSNTVTASNTASSTP